MKKIVPVALFLIAGFCFSQEKIPYKHSEEISEKALEASNREDFAQAIELINSIDKRDSLYCNSLVSKSFFLIKLERFDDAIKVADTGLSNECSGNELSFYLNKGVALDSKELYSEAHEAYDAALKKYPKNALLWYNKGVIYDKQKMVAEAVNAYQRAIIFQPTYQNAHLKLGNICYRQELMAQALMCYNMYLILDPEAPNAFEVLKSVNALVADKNPNKADPGLQISPEDSSFETIDLVLDNKFALNANYEIENKIKLPLVKPTHALIDQLKQYEGTEGFWAKTYVPFYKWIESKGLFNDFVYTLTFPVQNEEYKKILEKNLDKVISFYALYRPKWHEIIKESNIVFDEKDKGLGYLFEDEKLAGIGKFQGEKLVGKWTIYNSDGMVSGGGEFNNNGNRNGDWSWVYPNGKLKETVKFKDGKLEGENLLFYENGNKNVVAAFKNDELHGEYQWFNENGALEQKKFFKDGKLDGEYKAYFSVGEILPEFINLYENGSIKGKTKEYYSNGDLFMETSYLKEQKNGPEKKYHFQEKLHSEINHINGIPSGKHLLYYSNGNIMEKGEYVDGEISGNFESYYPDGTPKFRYIIEKGKINGLSENFDKDGKLHYTYTYKKGEIIAYKFYDKEGKVLSEAEKKKNEFQYKGLSPFGQPIAEGLYDIKGGRTSLWKFYDKGEITGQGNYLDDMAHGEHTYYHPGGKKKSQVFYQKDTLQGYYAEYYPNEKMKSQGWYKNGAQEGEWRFYNIDGSLQSVNYFNDGKYNGDQEYFGVGGKKTSSFNYRHDAPVLYTTYSPDGEVFEKVDYVSGGGEYVLSEKHFNGKEKSSLTMVNGINHGPMVYNDYYGHKKVTGNYVNGLQHGQWTWYYDDGKIEGTKNFLLGKLDGEVIDYYKNGKIEQKGNYEQDLEVGKSVSYYEDGKEQTSTDYSFGELHGRKEFYSPSGKFQLVRFYIFDRLVGYSYYDENGKELPMIPLNNETGKVVAYYDNGKISREMEYLNGRVTNTYKEYYYSGQLESEEEYDNGYYQGASTEYHENGNIRIQREYTYDNLQGVEKEFYSNGKKKSEIPYVNGVIHGDSMFYNEKGELVKKEKTFNGYIYSSETF